MIFSILPKTCKEEIISIKYLLVIFSAFSGGAAFIFIAWFSDSILIQWKSKYKKLCKMVSLDAPPCGGKLQCVI